MNARTATWLSWAMWALTLALTACSLFLLAVNSSRPGVNVFDYWVETTLIAGASSTVGAVIVSHRPGNTIGWLFCVIGILGAIRHLNAQYATYASLVAPGLPGADIAAWISSWIWTLYVGLYALLGLLFPNGRLTSRRWRWVAWIGGSMVVTGAMLLAFSSGPVYGLDPITNPFAVSGTTGLIRPVVLSMYTLVLVAVASMFARLLNASGIERQQLKWTAYAAAVVASGVFFGRIVSEVTGVWWATQVGFGLLLLGLVSIPITMGVAILKYHLYDIDVLINRTLVYGALSASVVGIYVFVVGTLGRLFQVFQVSGNLTISLFATGLIAVLFQPLRSRLQGAVNRLMYGERDDPYAVLSRLGRRLEGTLVPEAALETVVEAVTQALKLPYAAIELRQGGEFRRVAQQGTLKGEIAALSLVYQGEEVGRLLVSPRSPGEAFSPQDRRLLKDLAWQAGAAAHAARLTADLRRSRERLITAREEERRRLRRDLHDGLGPTLGGLTLGLDAARSTLPQGAETAEALLSELKAQTREAVSDVRRLVHGLRPPALDDLGLVPAIRQQASIHGVLADDPSDGVIGEASHENCLVFSVEATKQLPPLSAAVEVACYRIAQEAITNVSRHAKASHCRVNLTVDESRNTLVLEVTDDGVGMPDDRLAGVGMTSMRERAEELGGTLTVERNPEGGTRVLADLLLPRKEEQQ